MGAAWAAGSGDSFDFSDLFRSFMSGGPHGHGGPGGPRFRGGPGHRGPGGGGWGGPGFAGPWSWGGFSKGPRAGRGDVRTAILALLSEEPMHGYQIIQEIGRRSGGAWKPSPGSVYPTLQQLEDEGLVRAVEQDGRRVFRLTDAGQAHVAGRADELGSLWDAFDRGDGDDKLGDLVFQVAAAFVQVARTGRPDQLEAARKVLARTRADLYRILGDGDDLDEEEPDGGERT